MLAVLLGAFLVGCGSDDEPESAADAPAAADTTSGSAASGDAVAGKNIYLVGAGDVNPWAKAHNHAIIDALKADGAKVTYLQDPYDVQKEVQNLNRAVSAKPDLILLLAVDFRATVPALKRAQAAGIPVVNMSDPPGPTEQYVTASVEADHVALGTFAAQNVAEGLKAQGRDSGNVIAITGTKSLEQVGVRMDAFRKELAKDPGFKLVAVEDGNWDQATTQKIAQQLFAKYAGQGGIQAAYGMADNQAQGIIQAAKQADMKVGGKDGLVVTGSNCYQFGLESIKAGEQYGTATQSPTQEAEFVVEQTRKLLAGQELPKRQQAEETRVTAENVDEILEQKLCP
jgi:ABC-type sugar transport system substrate-binding protein